MQRLPDCEMESNTVKMNNFTSDITLLIKQSGVI